MEIIVKELTLAIATIIEAIAAILVAIGTFRALLSYGKSILKELAPSVSVRLALGKTLAIALEFLLGADILRTAVSPSWEDIGKLASIAALRTLLNYFLEKELRSEQK